jgi:hypothetical protein
MTESDKLNDYFVCVIVDDDKDKIEMNKMVISAFGINSVCVEKDFYSNLTRHIYNIHDEGKFPIIFLDGNLGFGEKTGSEIVKSLRDVFKDKGGILIPSSSNYKQQLDEWRDLINTEVWTIPEEGKLPIEYFRDGDIERYCKEYLENFSNGEQGSEVKGIH